MQTSVKLTLVGLVFAALAACGGSINAPVEVPDGARDATASQTVNGAISVGNDATVTSGNFRSVNGSATIGSRSTVPAVSLVNGRIRVGEDSTTGELSTVNGSITVGARTRVNDGISTVNGTISLEEGAVAVGEVSAVNGRVTVNGAIVNGNIESVNGGVMLAGAAVLDGDLFVRRPRGAHVDDRPPEVVIGPRARVTGRMVFEREVTLKIHRGAEVGEIEGATPEWVENDEG